MIVGLAGSEFIYGRHWRSWFALTALERQLIRKDAEAAELHLLVAETRLMMYMRLGQIASLFRCTPLLRLICRRAQKLYEDTRQLLERRGAWGRLQALQHNAERLGVGSVRAMPLPSHEGYRNLGLISMDVITTRDWVRSAPWGLSTDKQQAARDALVKAEQYGWRHEAWKFHWLLLWRGSGGKVKHLRAWWKYFWQTQYPATARIFQLLVNLVPQNPGIDTP